MKAKLLVLRNDSTLHILFLVTLFLLFASNAFSVVQSINFNGSNNRIDYDLATGKYSVYFNGNKVITDAYAQANSNSVYKSNTGYTSRVYSSSAISDGYGTGTKHVITLTGTGLLQMQQIFYVYTNKAYFYTEVVLNGSGSNCYYMTPLTSASVNIYVSGVNRALFVPFDNDKWVRYNSMTLSSSNFTGSDVTALFDNTSRKGLIAGAVEQTDWKTGVSVKGSGAQTLSNLSVFGGWTNSTYTYDNRGHGWVGVGQTTCKSPRVFVGYFDDWRYGFEEYGKSLRLGNPKYVSNWTGGTPFGWNSWGVIQSGLNLTKANAVVDFFANSCTGFRTSDNTLYIDLDSYWDNMSDADLKSFCDYAKSKGLKPGVYWAPFVDWGKTSRTIEGSTYNYSSIWTLQNGSPVNLDGAYAIDPTHPGTKDRIRYFVNRFKTAGFQMIKLDFLTHASLEADGYYDGSVKTGMQAFNHGMKYVIDQLAGTMLVYASISPNIATGRFAHMRRIACDAYKTISDTKYTLNSTNYGWWQKYVYDYIDADHVVFGTESLGANQARLASSLITGTVITGDDFSTTGTWTTRAQTLLQNQDLLDISENGWPFQPIEGNTGDQPNEQFMRGMNNYMYLAVFNYGTSSKNYSITMSRLGLNSAGYNTVKELFSGTTTSTGSTMSVTVGATAAKIFRFDLSTPKTSVTSITEESANALNVSIYPNPASDYLNIESPEVISNVSLTSLTGQLLKEVKNNSKNYKLDVRSLNQGLYFITVLVKNGTSSTVKFEKL